MIRVTGNNMKSEIAYAIQEYNGAPIYSYGDLAPLHPDVYLTDDTECDPLSFGKFVLNDIEEKVKVNEYLPIPMIIIYTNLDSSIRIAIIANYIKEMEDKGLVGNVVFMTRWAKFKLKFERRENTLCQREEDGW